jgi:hypothetical protein
MLVKRFWRVEDVSRLVVSLFELNSVRQPQGVKIVRANTPRSDNTKDVTICSSLKQIWVGHGFTVVE